MTELTKSALRRSTAIPGLPDTTLLDCLFVTGKRGGGKSFSQRLAMERALSKGLRCGWVDSLGVGWGVTVAGDPADLEKPIGPGYDVVVFGGEHGHMPLSDGSGAALGVMLAKAKFSWVIDLKIFKSKAKRVAFMAAFLEALYENTESQLLLLLDEVDLWAPQQLIDKRGPAPALLGIVDEIVRRGRIKGFSVWMATQRPAVVNKNIISQADGMVAFKTIAPQDTDAVMAWMKAHLKKEAYAEWLAQLSVLKKGEAVVYLTEPELSIRRQQFPVIETLDTFKPRTKGQKQSDVLAAKPDIEALKNQLGALEEKLKADDPAHLKAEVTRLTRELAAEKRTKPALAPVPKADTKADNTRIRSEGYNAGWAAALKETRKAHAVTVKAFDSARSTFNKIAGLAMAAAEHIPVAPPEEPSAPTAANFSETAKAETRPAPASRSGPKVNHAEAPRVAVEAPEGVSQRHMAVLDAIAWWVAAGIDAPSRVQVAGKCGHNAGGGYFRDLLGKLSGIGLIAYPKPGTVQLTDAGRAAAPAYEMATQDELHRAVEDSLEARHWAMLKVLIDAYPEEISRADLAAACGKDAGGGYFRDLVGKLSGLEMVAYPRQGAVKAADWLFI